MDTRNKILTAEEALARQWDSPVVVTGWFDLLRAELVRELGCIRERAGGAAVVAVVVPAEGAALPQRARAELAAATRMIDYVLTAERRELDPLLFCLKPRELVRLETADARRARQFIEHVRIRHNR